MVRVQIAGRGLGNRAVLDALAAVPRHAFVPADLADVAYGDGPLPIGENQTISQPYVVALMCDALALRPTDRVLEVGTGCGYAAAVLARLVADVYTIERHESLALGARARLAGLGYDKVFVRCGDGTRGWPDAAPFDAISVAAGDTEVPTPLLQQLAVGGRLVMPVGGSHTQQLVRVTRAGLQAYDREYLGAVRFVPLVSDAGSP